MSTKKKRINISVSGDTEAILEKIADRDQVPMATKAQQLIQAALEIEEDEVFDQLAASRDTKDAKFVDFDEAWD